MFGSNGKKTELPLGGKETLTFLARGFEFKGSLTFEGTVRIDGAVEGEIRSSGTVILGEHAVIEGDVRAETVVSGGRVKGNVMATERVHLLPSAVVHGDVIAPLVQMEEGVRFHGSCEAEGRTKRKSAEEPREASPPAVRRRVS
jgi:cytoskeletal protein CcmA (bactofilin family)